MLKSMDNDQFLQEILQKNYSQHLRQLKTPINMPKNLKNNEKIHKSCKCLVDSINFEIDKTIIRFYNKDFETHKKASYVLSPKPSKFYNDKFKTSRLFEPSDNCNFKYKTKSLSNFNANPLKYKLKQLSVHLPPIINSPKIRKTKRISLGNSSPKLSKLFGSRSVNLHIQGESQIPLYINHDKSKQLYDCLFTEDYSKNLEGELEEENFGNLEEENFGNLDEENFEDLDKNIAEIF
ncbi:unnamed protein product [Blepharisma stoltei]|uniref:Uncharacterized protein n=1 Tax=Blepharisma stoltei TaxID=1481888 RepID=A0AAU9ITT4_9CILI|nr:unnamed protein product [Blepharisma stoltei]